MTQSGSPRDPEVLASLHAVDAIVVEPRELVIKHAYDAIGAYAVLRDVATQSRAVTGEQADWPGVRRAAEEAVLAIHALVRMSGPKVVESTLKFQQVTTDELRLAVGA